MAVKRKIPSEISQFGGGIIYQWLQGASVSTDAEPDYFEFDVAEIFPRYKNYLVFLNVTGISGTWQIRVFTSLRLSSTGTHRHRVMNQLQLVGITTTGQKSLGANVYSGGTTLFAEKLMLEVDSTACGLPPCNIDFDADVIFYN